ncbi:MULTISPECIES: type II toxin-antitoxin system VapC family toxin [unclassified Rhizobium]|uniref:type II toxin-antitoxin system VapC family toxin n=1 Tax=unclassified Rhizobium TaxID=2613769 RepID=UPI00115C88E5|nr:MULTISPECIES: type II toxin-antitoxin system VapC family toxin [unclassified Rhizobium]MBO9135921.1 type II toxin-antitoxin system VapC family toxin [Rhizobium sp. B209b/85]MBO9171232.1 type II toxin-antitoxin system VapC family toxin [Rhizobium sp. L245/93]QXZ99345.1 type II toxin-antitoxin system VapC family toxin [Rhizobium sp. B230/85]TQX87712.1 type II toxin-antitoxin system VapC family toxin [Rhizobium sp. rho-13.1]TQY14641.1 type II toxin-antitoxin system VapC family toxin [Rhizobium
MFIDGSVLLAMMTDEEAAREFARRMQASTVRLTSPMTVARTTLALVAELEIPVDEASEAVATFLQLMNIQSVAVPPRAASLAVEAYSNFGKNDNFGKGGAGLSLDDCLTYACAKYYRQPLLFSGNGFAATDIEAA